MNPMQVMTLIRKLVPMKMVKLRTSVVVVEGKETRGNEKRRNFEKVVFACDLDFLIVNFLFEVYP